MTTYALKEFQEKAQARFKKILDDLEYVPTLEALAKNPADPIAQKNANEGINDPFRIQIDAPTGSGKTVLISFLAKDILGDYVHIVFSPGAGNLEEQTARRLSSILGETNVTLIDETIFGQPAATGMTYVGNWEQFVSRDNKTGLYKNRTVREGDVRNLFDWVSEIGSQFLPVVITIDEAHYGSAKGISSITRFLDDIQKTLGYSPLLVEASATHVLEGTRKVKIELKDVIQEGLIRKSIRLNGIDLIERVDFLSPEQRGSYQIEPFLLDFAIEKQQKLDEEYVRINAFETIDGNKVYQHCLIGIQVPNGPVGNAVIERVETRLRDVHGISRENGLLAVFLSDDKTANMANIDSPASAARVLIYKQGVATGWDCPRAQILLGYRHITSKIFTKQNLGRFMRTTEGKHYGNDLLDYAYVISNVGDLGQASFGDDISADLNYEMEAVYRIFEGEHVALTSFNEVSLPQCHFGFTNQTVVKPSDIMKEWIAAAAKVSLWNHLEYSSVSSMAEGLMNGKIDVEDLFGNDEKLGFTTEGVSKALAKNNGEQMLNFSNMINGVLAQSGRDYGNNSQVVRTLSTIIIRWYREAVEKEANATYAHHAKLSGARKSVDAETDQGLRNGNPDWVDIAVEQISLDAYHWNAVQKVVKETLKHIKSVRIVDEDDFKTKGVPWAERTLIDDGTFKVNPLGSKWVTPEELNKVTGNLANLYATRMVVGEASYKEGPPGSGPEKSFEDTALTGLISTKGNRLGSFYKSPENKTDSYRVGVKTESGSVSTFYPDYLGEILTEDGKYIPFVIEVKSADDVKANINTDTILRAKAKYLVELNSDNVKAGLVYQSTEGLWLIITGFDEKTSTVKTENFKEFMCK
jgi:hypothetical protein